MVTQIQEDWLLVPVMVFSYLKELQYVTLMTISATYMRCALVHNIFLVYQVLNSKQCPQDHGEHSNRKARKLKGGRNCLRYDSKEPRILQMLLEDEKHLEMHQD